MLSRFTPARLSDSSNSTFQLSDTDSSAEGYLVNGGNGADEKSDAEDNVQAEESVRYANSIEPDQLQKIVAKLVGRQRELEKERDTFRDELYALRDESETGAKPQGRNRYQVVKERDCFVYEGGSKVERDQFENEIDYLQARVEELLGEQEGFREKIAELLSVNNDLSEQV